MISLTINEYAKKSHKYFMYIPTEDNIATGLNWLVYKMTWMYIQTMLLLICFKEDKVTDNP